MSVVFDIQNHVQTLLEGAVDSPTKVVFGYAQNKDQVLIFGAKFDSEFRYLGGNPAPQQVKFEIPLIFDVLAHSGRDMKPAVERCWEVFDLVEAAIRGDHTLEGLSWNALLSKGEQSFFQTDKAQGCRIESTLAGTARI